MSETGPERRERRADERHRGASAAPAAPATLPFTTDELATIARRHRLVMRVWLSLLAVWFTILLLMLLGLPAVGPALMTVVLLLHFAAAATVGRLRLAMGDPPLLAWTFIAGSCALPIINLLLIPIDTLDAARTLRDAFGPVPVSGFTDEELRRAASHCPGCGYPLAGLPGPVCPECGFVKTPPLSNA